MELPSLLAASCTIVDAPLDKSVGDYTSLLQSSGDKDKVLSRERIMSCSSFEDLGQPALDLTK